MYLYTNKVVIPPLTKQDNTLSVSERGLKSRKMNNFLNTRTKIMGLQSGSQKCEKMHIGKKRFNSDICVDFEVDIWKYQLFCEEIKIMFLLTIMWVKKKSVM